MAAKTTLQSLLGRHTEVLAEFRRRLAEVQREGGVPSATIVLEKTRLLEAAEGRLAEARQARQATVERLDARIATLEERAQRLRAEIEADRQAIDPNRRPDGPGPKLPGLDTPRPTRPSGQRPVQPPARGAGAPTVTVIKGIGKAYSERLQAAGVRTPAALAKMKPAEVAAALSISEERAQALVAAAKKVK